jgi:serine/threonine protein kinase
VAFRATIAGVRVDPSDEQTLARVGLVPANDPQSAGVPRAGDVIAAKYRVERVLGVGGMGIVLAVTHLQLGEAYAIKCLLPGGAADAETVERFMREARAAVRIKSEHIARVSDVGKLDNGSPYILMEYLSGHDLSDVLRASGPLSIRDAVEYVLQACTGIAEAHALGIVHRDLKPSNLFLTQRLDGASLVKVLDFGISKAVADSGPHQPSLTQTASVFGSPAYMSPEQIRSAKNVDFRTDVWALGVILYELLTGELPFVAETSGGLLSAIAADEPRRLRERRRDATEALEAIVARCLEKKVHQRFQSVSELATALEPFRSAGSLVSVGRIRRLSGAPANQHVHLAVTPASNRQLDAAPVDVGAATDKAWTTGSRDTKTSRGLRVLVGAAVIVSVASFGLYAGLRWGGAGRVPVAAETARSTAEAVVPASGGSIASEPSLAPGPGPSAAPAVSSTSTSMSTPPTATARVTGPRPPRAVSHAQPATTSSAAASSGRRDLPAPPVLPSASATSSPPSQLDGPLENSH